LILPGTQTPNSKIVGRPATTIAEMAGIKAPPATRVLIARLEPEQVGREFPLSAEKLSPILAFYAVPNLAASIALCRRLLEFGGLGHTCSIHSQNRAAILEFGAAVPAFRVVVNSSAVHGSIGYSTNLFPAMTLGCGAPGGNVKRIAWESRGIEHRTVPADQRMTGAAPLTTPEAVQAKTNVTPVGQALMPIPPVEAAKSAVSAAPAEEGQTTPLSDSGQGVSALSDRATISQVVEHVMAAHGIARGSAAPKAMPSPKELPSPSAVAAEIAGRVFGSPGRPKAEPAPNSSTVSPTTPKEEAPIPHAIPPKSESPAKPAVEISSFVSENDVRRAMTRSEKIFIGPKTILTPSARDLGMEHEVFVETDAGSIR
jgi:hypothetical protein